MINIQCLGHLVTDPVERDTSNGGKFVSFPFATNDKNGTIFLSCRAFGGTAKNIMQYLKKGSHISIVGTIYELGTYKAKDETIKPSCVVSIDRFDCCDSKLNGRND